jgi:hypothetical protein
MKPDYPISRTIGTKLMQKWIVKSALLTSLITVSASASPKQTSTAIFPASGNLCAIGFVRRQIIGDNQTVWYQFDKSGFPSSPVLEIGFSIPTQDNTKFRILNDTLHSAFVNRIPVRVEFTGAVGTYCSGMADQFSVRFCSDIACTNN